MKKFILLLGALSVLVCSASGNATGRPEDENKKMKSAFAEVKRRAPAPAPAEAGRAASLRAFEAREAKAKAEEEQRRNQVWMEVCAKRDAAWEEYSSAFAENERVAKRFQKILEAAQGLEAAQDAEQVAYGEMQRTYLVQIKADGKTRTEEVMTRTERVITSEEDQAIEVLLGERVVAWEEYSSASDKYVRAEKKLHEILKAAQGLGAAQDAAQEALEETKTTHQAWIEAARAVTGQALIEAVTGQANAKLQRAPSSAVAVVQAKAQEEAAAARAVQVKAQEEVVEALAAAAEEAAESAAREIEKREAIEAERKALHEAQLADWDDGRVDANIQAEDAEKDAAKRAALKRKHAEEYHTLAEEHAEAAAAAVVRVKHVPPEKDPAETERGRDQSFLSPPEEATIEAEEAAFKERKAEEEAAADLEAEAQEVPSAAPPAASAQDAVDPDQTK